MRKSEKKQQRVVMSAKDLLLGDDSVHLLRAIDRGQTVFEPETTSAAALETFQQIVKVLRMLESRRCIAEISSLNLVTGDERVCIDRVRVSGGLTAKGRVVLAYYEERAEQQYQHHHDEAA